MKYFCVCLFLMFVCCLCMSMVLPQAGSKQSFSATNLLCFPYNINNWTSGMHAVWWRSISESGCWSTSALVWHGLSSHEFLHTCFTRGTTSKGEDKPPARWLKRKGEVSRQRPTYIPEKQLWLGWCVKVVRYLENELCQIPDFNQLLTISRWIERVQFPPCLLWQTIHYYKLTLILKCA